MQRWCRTEVDTLCARMGRSGRILRLAAALVCACQAVLLFPKQHAGSTRRHASLAHWQQLLHHLNAQALLHLVTAYATVTAPLYPAELQMVKLVLVTIQRQKSEFEYDIKVN